jgi:molybdopterin molybdotransferase
VPDDPEMTRAAAREALSHSHLVLTVGGVSVGQRDFLPAAWQALGLTTILHGVNIQPGRPLLAVRDDCKLVLGLPGNPVSVLCTAHLFTWPVIRAILGQAPPELPWRTLPLAEPVKGSSKREVFRAAKLETDGAVRVITWHGSGDLVHTAEADGFVRLPLSDEPVAAGTRVPFLEMVR